MNLLYDISKYLENINTDSLCNLLLYDPRQPLLFNTGLFLVLFVAFLFIYRGLRFSPTIKKLFVYCAIKFYYVLNVAPKYAQQPDCQAKYILLV